MIDRLEFAASYAYSPYGSSAESVRSRTLRQRIKAADDEAVKLACARVEEFARAGRFPEWFGDDVTLVAVPGHAPLAPGAVSRTQRFCEELVRLGLARDASPLLERVTRVNKAAFAASDERPTAADHYESMAVRRILGSPRRIVLMDDVVTRGATFLGAATRLQEAFPAGPVRAFALVRTISPGEVERIQDPVTGAISLSAGGGSVRRP